MARTQKVIEVTIEEDGATKIEASGFTGGVCLKETESLEQALGKVGKRSMKAEASKAVTIADKTQVGGK